MITPTYKDYIENELSKKYRDILMNNLVFAEEKGDLKFYTMKQNLFYTSIKDLR